MVTKIIFEEGSAIPEAGLENEVTIQTLKLSVNLRISKKDRRGLVYNWVRRATSSKFMADVSEEFISDLFRTIDSDNFGDLFFKKRQFVFYNIPDYRIIYTKIVMN